MTLFYNPDQIFFDSFGNRVSLGKVYFGEPNKDPKTNPKPPYSDPSLSTAISATQTLTQAGKLPQMTYLSGDYSILCEKANGEQVFLNSSHSGQPNSDAENIAEIRLQNMAGITAVQTLGYTSAGDGGGALYRADTSDSSTADDGFLCIVSNDGVRFKLQYDDVITMAWTGATGDGVADDTNKLEAAVEACPVGGTVKGQSGKTYLMTSFTIAKALDVDLRGATLKGAATTNVGITCTANVNVYNGTSNNVWIAHSSSNVTTAEVCKMAFINPTFSQTGALSGASGVTVRNCTFTGRAQGSSGSATYPTFQGTTGATNCKYLDNVCTGVEAGVTWDGISSYTNSIEVRGNKFVTMRYYALKIDVGNYFIFENNYVEDSSHGIFFANDDTSGSGVSRDSGNQLVISQNTFVDISKTTTYSPSGTVSGCLYVSGTDNPYPRVVFRDNFMSGCDVGVARSNMHITIEGNHFYDGFSLYDYVDTGIKSGDLRIINNTIDATKEITGRGTDSDGEAIGAAILIPALDQDALNRLTPNVQIYGNTFTACFGNCIQAPRSSGSTGNPIFIHDNLFVPSADTTNLINVSISSALSIKDNRKEGSASNADIEYPNTANITGLVIVEDNEWQSVSSAPTTGTHIQGTVFRNSTPAASGNMGWVVTTTGDLAASGIVKSYGTIAS